MKVVVTTLCKKKKRRVIILSNNNIHLRVAQHLQNKHVERK